MSAPEIMQITYLANGKQYVAVPVSDQEVAAANQARNCNCGAETCVSGWVWRCMAGGGGQCVWYRTNEVC